MNDSRKQIRRTGRTSACLILSIMAYLLGGCSSTDETKTPSEVTTTEEAAASDAGASSQDTDLTVTGTIASFSTTDPYGNEVTESVFSEKDITMLNIWGTYCGPCIEEMPELGELEAELPDNAQIIGLICDVTPGSDTSGAQEIIASTKADYLHILYNYDMAGFMNNVYAVPTTFFIDGEGNLLGDPVVGADVHSYRMRLTEYLGAF